jgi:2-polyprenyl-6-methoxyphenol hydroxylase-like FAD-dependent oxidoreductase
VRSSDNDESIICGAGIAGLTLAWWLQRDGWHVEIVEHAPGPSAGGYMIDFFGSGYDVAEPMGLLPQLRKVHTTIEELTYVNPDEHGHGHIDYPRVRGVLRRAVMPAPADASAY